MATAAETVVQGIQEIKKSLEVEKTEKVALKAALEKSQADATAQIAEVKKGFDEKLKAFETLTTEHNDMRKALMEPDYAGSSPYKVFAQPKDEKGIGQFGFKSMTHFCHDVRMASRPSGARTSDIMKAYIEKAPSALNETVGAEGGFLVPPTFSSEIWQRSYDNSLWEMTTGHTAGANSNSLTFNAIDETSRADGSRFGGVRAYWEAEANQATTTKPAYNQIRLQLHKLLAITYVTEELMQDSGTAMEQHLYNLFGSEIKFKLGDSLINGSGAGMPLGVLNSSALVTVSEEVGQPSATLVFENLSKMWSRMWAPSRANAVWLINQDVEPQLFGLALNVGTGGMPAYLPPGGLSDKPYGTLFGRPVVPTEFNAALGTVGDVLLVDLKQMYSLRKGETQQESSIHIRFDYAETAFRVVFRADARSLWLSALTPYKGSATKSPYIAIETR